MSENEIVVVSGLPRSGTSLMMQMLAAGGIPILTDGVRPPDEDNPRGYLEYEPVKGTKRDNSWVEAGRGKAVKVVHALLPDLPAAYHYRVILMRRPLAQVVASQRAMLERLGRPGGRLPDETLAGLLGAQLNAVADWVTIQLNFHLLEIEYHACIANPLDVASQVSAFLDGRADAALMAAAVDPSLYRRK
jgi:hypothetical protein